MHGKPSRGGTRPDTRGAVFLPRPTRDTERRRDFKAESSTGVRKLSPKAATLTPFRGASGPCHRGPFSEDLPFRRLPCSLWRPGALASVGHKWSEPGWGPPAPGRASRAALTRSPDGQRPLKGSPPRRAGPGAVKEQEPGPRDGGRSSGSSRCPPASERARRRGRDLSPDLRRSPRDTGVRGAGAHSAGRASPLPPLLPSGPGLAGLGATAAPRSTPSTEHVGPGRAPQGPAEAVAGSARLGDEGRTATRTTPRAHA